MSVAPHALGWFLAAKRASVPRAALGLSPTPWSANLGLRREEVAALADVSIHVYTRMEQGRDIEVSRDLLKRVAKALCLSEQETARCYELAGLSATTGPLLDHRWEGLLDAISDCPAFVCNARLDVVAFNPMANYLFDFASDGSRYALNQVWRLYMDARRRKLYMNVDREMMTLARMLRSNYVASLRDEQFDALVADLQLVNPAFARYWSQSDTADFSESDTVCLRLSGHGQTTVRVMRLTFSGATGESLVTLVPVDKTAALRFRALKRSATRPAPAAGSPQSPGTPAVSRINA